MFGPGLEKPQKFGLTLDNMTDAKLRHPKNLLQLANNTKDNRAGEKPYRLSKTGPSPILINRLR